jgi:plasmid stabilization system protein ParE
VKYRVRWKRSALEELADVWAKANSQDRRAITAAVHSIESELAAAAGDAGESRSGEERIIFEAPAAVLFEVRHDQNEVLVLQIWRY